MDVFWNGPLRFQGKWKTGPTFQHLWYFVSSISHNMFELRVKLRQEVTNQSKIKKYPYRLGLPCIILIMMLQSKMHLGITRTNINFIHINLATNVLTKTTNKGSQVDCESQQECSKDGCTHIPQESAIQELQFLSTGISFYRKNISGTFTVYRLRY